MKLTTIALAIAFALPTSFAFAEGTMNYAAPVARPVVRGVTVMRPIARRPPRRYGRCPTSPTGCCMTITRRTAANGEQRAASSE